MIWSADLRGALEEKNFVDHVFYDNSDTRATLKHQPPQAQKDSIEQKKYLNNLKAWTIKDLHAFSVILRKLDLSIRQDFNTSQTAHELCMTIVDID